MIKNNKQLEVSKTRLNEFQASLVELTQEKEAFLNPVLQKAQISALRSSIKELEQEISIYESLREGELCTIIGGQFHEIARILIQTRIAKGWTQSRLAEEIGIEPQQIQRYEATDYEGAGLTRLYDVIDALEVSVSFDRITVAKDSFSPNPETEAIQQKIIERKQLFSMRV